MSETPSGAQTESATPSDGQTAPLIINGQFIKDLSFEAPNAPQIFSEMKSAPQIKIDVDVQARKIGEKNVFEVSLQFNVESKSEETVAFLIELVYSSVVTLNVNQDALEPMLLIEVPRHLFPFSRQLIAELTTQAGFPPLMITPIDFVSLYRQRQAQLKSQAAGAAGSAQPDAAEDEPDSKSNSGKS